MNKEFIHKVGVDYTVHYTTDDDAINVIHAIYGTLDSGSIDANFEIPTPTDVAKQKAFDMLGLNEDYWRFEV